MSAEGLKNEYLQKYKANGEEKFYRFLLLMSLNDLILIQKGLYIGTSPELKLLNCYEQFIFIYRREGDDVYLSLAKLFRRAAHKIYRIMLKKEMTVRNAKFLNLV